MKALDTARNTYRKLPTPIRRMVSYGAGIIPIKFRYGKTYFQYREWIDRAENDPEFVNQWRNQKLADFAA